MDDRRQDSESTPCVTPLYRCLYWCAVAALAAMGGWIVNREAPNPEYDKAMALRGQLAQLDDDDDQQREDLHYDLQKLMSGLDQASRDRITKAMQVDSQLRRQRAIDRFFDLPQSEQIAELDRRIDEMEARRRLFEEQQREIEESEQVEVVEHANESGHESAPALRNSQVEQSPESPTDAPPRFYGPRFPGGRHSLEHLTLEQRQRREEFYRLLYQRREERGLPAYSSSRRL